MDLTTFATAVGSRRGDKGRNARTARNVRAQMTKSGQRTDSANTDAARSDVAIATHEVCPDCGYQGLACEHFVNGRIRKLVVFVVVALAVAGLTVASRLGGTQMLFLAAAPVVWHVFRDAGCRALMVCPECRTGVEQRPEPVFRLLLGR